MSVRRSALELMPKWLICVPLVVQWLYLSVRYGSPTLPSVANPAITAGGLVGEAKLEYFQSMGTTARAATAHYCALPPALRQSTQAVREAMAQAGLTYPLMAKPDLGMCGFGVRLVGDEIAMGTYLEGFPPDQCVVLQEYLPWEGEAGIFYARQPGAARGEIIGLALRYFPRVAGDGASSLAALMAADPRARRVLGRTDHQFLLDTASVPALGEVVRLSTIGSTRVGGLYRDGRVLVTPALAKAVDAIAQDMTGFHFGRFDVRFSSTAQLARGEGFKIMEVNGAGSEAIEAWDPDTGLFRAFGLIFSKQRRLFEIAAENRRRGYRPISLHGLARLHFMQQRLLDAYPPSN